MGIFVITNGRYFIKDSVSKRDYYITESLSEALRVTRKEGNRFILRNSKLEWFKEYRIAGLNEAYLIDKKNKENLRANENAKKEENSSINIEQKTSESSSLPENNTSSKTESSESEVKSASNKYLGESRTPPNDKLVSDVNTYASLFLNFPLKKESLIAYKKEMEQILDYYSLSMTDMVHTMCEENPTDEAKIKIYNTAHEAANKRKETKQAICRVEILIQGLENSWDLATLQETMAKKGVWKEYKGRTEYYEKTKELCKCDVEGAMDTENKAEKASVKPSRVVPNRKKKVLVYDKSRNLIHEYDSVTEAAVGMGLAKSTVSDYCRKVRPDKKGYNWEYMIPLWFS